MVKNLPASAEAAGDASWTPRSGRSLEEEMASHSSVIAWEMPWTEGPGKIQSTGSKSRM